MTLAPSLLLAAGRMLSITTSPDARSNTQTNSLQCFFTLSVYASNNYIRQTDTDKIDTVVFGFYLFFKLVDLD